jgi:DNA repair photolyase
MKTGTAKEIRDELKDLTADELRQVVQRLARFKKENKELLTYLLFEAHHEDDYVENIKQLMDERFTALTTPNFYYIKKGIRKILSDTKKYIRYSGNKETEVALLIHFLKNMSEFKPSILKNKILTDIYMRQTKLIRVRIATLHEDLQYDYDRELNFLEV